MIFDDITEYEYTTFWNNHKQKCFLSSPKTASLRKDTNWNVSFVGLKNNNNIVGACMLLYRKTFFNKYEYYAIRGPLIDYNNIEIREKFFKELKLYLKKHNALNLRIDPYIIDAQRDIDGNIISDGINNYKIIDFLKKIGFKYNKYGEQNALLFSLNLKDKTEKEILSEMKPNTRNMINKVIKSGINIRELEYDELNIFYDILKSTGSRKEFEVKSLKYYQKMYNLYKENNEVKFLVTELNLDEHIAHLNSEKQKKENDLKNLNDAKYNDGKRNSLKNELESINKKIKIDNDIINKYHKHTIQMSASMFLLVKPEITYLSSGNYDEFMNFNSQYLLQWEMIKYGIANGYDKYNFYGIITYSDKNNKDYGIYEFKRGFNGYVEKLIGEYELPISNLNIPISLLRKIKRIVKRS